MASQTNIATAAMGLVALGCAQILGITDGESRADADASAGTGGADSGSGGDTSGGTGGASGTGASGGTGGQAGLDGGLDASDGGEEVTYNDVQDATQWQTFVLTGIAGLSAGYQGGTFDGRYVYFSPSTSGGVLRYDTTASFVNRASWLTFNVTTAYPNAIQYAGGAIFAAGHVQFVPYSNATTEYGFTVAYDTAGAFDDAASWTPMSLATANAGAAGYVGSAFDGQYVYYAPFHRGTVPTLSAGVYHGLVARYDSTATFGDATAWTFYNAATGDPASLGFYGAVFANGYVYFVPYRKADGTANGTATRYNTAGAFDAATSWTAFDISTLNVAAKGFIGGVFDGRYVYFVPYHNGATHGLVARYDTQSSFTTATSWSVFDTEQVDALAKGFSTGAFDGRYVYLVPNNAGTSGTVVRFDTQATFDDVASWTSFDLASLNASAKSFWGAVFDGEYVYLIPQTNDVVARFHARTPRASAPPYNGGSFY